MVCNQNEKRNSTLRTKSGQRITNCGVTEPICGGILPLFVKPACGKRDIVLIYVHGLCMPVCMHLSRFVQAITCTFMHGF